MITPGTQRKQLPEKHLAKKPVIGANLVGGDMSSVVLVLGLSGLMAATLSLALSCPALATKLNAKPLPHAGASDGSKGVSGDVNEYGRPVKDFSHGKEDTLPNSQYKERHDYREAAKQQKEDAEAKAKAQVDAVKKAQEDRINAIKNYQAMAIDANNKAIALGKQGKLTEAIAEHELSLKYDPTNKQFRINLSAAQTLYGQKLLAQKDFAGAANMFRKGLTAMPDNGQAGKYLNQAVQRMGLDPNSSDNRIGIGDELYASGDITGANIEYQQAMRIDPSARTYTKMGDMYLRYGPTQAANAVSWYRQAIVKDAEYGPAHRQLGNILLAMHDMTGAASELRRAVTLDPKDTAAGQALIEIWRHQVALNPNLAENHLGLGTAMQLTGDLTTADNEYNQVERLDPHNTSLTAARASLQRYVKHMSAEKHKSAAETFYNQNLGRDALAEIGQAVMIEPRNDKYQFLLGQCLESSRDLENAKQAYHTCVLLDPKNNEAASHLRDVESLIASGGHSQGQQIQRPQAAGLTRADAGANQAGQQNSQMGIQSTQGSAPQGGQTGQNGGASGRDTKMFESSPAQAAGRAPSQGSYSRGPATAYNNNSGQTNQQRPQAAAQGQTIDPQTRATLTAADNMEKQGDFQGAANLLQQSLSTNLQNPEIHHRLACILLNLGQLEEAVSEFRIAAALNPGNKEFVDDYARAMKIRKKAMPMDDGGQATGGGQTTGAVGDLK